MRFFHGMFFGLWVASVIALWGNQNFFPLIIAPTALCVVAAIFASIIPGLIKGFRSGRIEDFPKW
ncbi:hypothetical protein [Salaquimonas pukyongi]|uniref:hypothetical protein n=1 Tax=Salaquimonas pukyongi TaxID=2712698 RepID=UPI00096B704C|nr:hypothetical protein [Salaquimonas pukyongi]